MTLTIKELKEAIEDLPDNLPVVIRSGNAYYEVTDIDNTSLALEISSGTHYEFE